MCRTCLFSPLKRSLCARLTYKLLAITSAFRIYNSERERINLLVDVASRGKREVIDIR